MVAVLASTLESFFQMLSVLAIFVFVLIITYLTTRWIASYQKKHSFNRNLEVVETLKITPNKFVQIIRTGDEYLVIAIGKDDVQLLTHLSKDQLEEIPLDSQMFGASSEGFKEIFEKLTRYLPKK